MSLMNDKHVKARLWRRLAAMWIDSFLIYAVASPLVAIAAAIRIRIALEPL